MTRRSHRFLHTYALLAVCFVGSTSAQFGEGRRVGNLLLSNSPTLQVSSIAASRRNEGLLWITSSSSTLLHAITSRGQNKGTWELRDATGYPFTSFGVQNVAVGLAMDSTSYIYLNPNQLIEGDSPKSIRIYRVREPPEPSEPLNEASDRTPAYELMSAFTDLDTITLFLPDNASSVSEHLQAGALMVDSLSGEIIITIKDTNSSQVIYATPVGSAFAEGSFESMLLPKGDFMHWETTAGDISPDGAEVIIRSGTDIYLYPRLRNDIFLASEAMADGDGFEHVVSVDQDGEAIAFASDSSGFYTVSSELGLYYYGRVSPTLTLPNATNTTIHNNTGAFQVLDFTIVPQNQNSTLQGFVTSSPTSTLETDFPSRSPTTESPTMTSLSPSLVSAKLGMVPSESPSDSPSMVPSNLPSKFPSSMPSTAPSALPSDSPSALPSGQPSSLPPALPSSRPSETPCDSPSSDLLRGNPSAPPSFASSPAPSLATSSPTSAGPKTSNATTATPTSTTSHNESDTSQGLQFATVPPLDEHESPSESYEITEPDWLEYFDWFAQEDTPEWDENEHVEPFIPGLLTHMEHGLLLSSGLTARLIAETGKPVCYGPCNQVVQNLDFEAYANITIQNVSLSPDIAVSRQSQGGVSVQALKPLTNVGNNWNNPDAFPLSLCESDCDEDRDCEGGLVCYFRDSGGNVPGCAPGEDKDSENLDYCGLPQLGGPMFNNDTNIGTNVATNNGTTALGMCESDCSEDSDCMGPLMCYSRDTNGFVPGCAGGGGDSDLDYCGLPKVTMVGNNWGNDAFPLGLCEGDCDEDKDCKPGLVCYQRESDGYVPGCAGGEDDGSDVDYCIAGSILNATNTSRIPFHIRPDFGATFIDTREGNEGGWVYVSNSESRESRKGGVGALTFDKDGNVLEYKMLLTGTTMNCGGGKTPWDTWVSCEEIGGGKLHQVDPFGQRDPEIVELGDLGGEWESFAYDIRNFSEPHFFATEDNDKGALGRYTPNRDTINWTTPESAWDMLHGDGRKDWLILKPSKDDSDRGTFEWTEDKDKAERSARRHYPNSEGIDVYDGTLWFVCKKRKGLFELSLDDGNYTRHSTIHGLFDGTPDQLQRILKDGEEEFMFFTEEGGEDAGIHGRDVNGVFFTLLESPIFPDETTGLAFSPDLVHMYVAYQHAGLLFDITRQDKLPLSMKTLNLKSHAMAET